MLELLRRWGAKQSQGMSVEFVDADRQLPIAYRNTIANMMAEAEALNGIFAPDEITDAWYRAKLPTASEHLLRTDGFEHVADIMVGSFYDPDLDEGCAFEELISFHGGIGGPQTRPFILHPTHLRVPDGPSSVPPRSTPSSRAGGGS